MNARACTLTLPIRLAMEDATNVEAAWMILVVKKIEPSAPSGNVNLRLKKYVIQDLLEFSMAYIVLVRRKGPTAMPNRKQTSRGQVGPTAE